MTDEDEDLLADLLLRWEELRDGGQDTSANELCQSQPHLIEELARRIKALKATAWLDQPIGPDDDRPHPTESPAEPRTLIGRYRLDDLVATGGFAQVWRAYDQVLQRVVAVKVPKTIRLQSADTFMAEARRVARLKHPGIVPVHDVGREGELCFIVSEFVEGGSLGDHLSRNPPTQQQAVRWIAEIADALEYAHLHGVIHRDIKPANILIDHHGRALLADFGIAQSANKAGQEALSLGTLRYMSPEQLEGKSVDPRSDIFSLGVVLHEVLTGNLPYSSVEPNVLRREIVAGAKVGLGLPTALRHICQKALECNPHRRHSSSAQLAAELRRVLDEPSPSSRRKLFVLVLLLVAIVVSPAVWWHSRKPAQVEGSVPKVVKLINETQISEFQQWEQRVSAMSAKEQVKAVSEKLRELNPGYDGSLETRIKGGVVISARIVGAKELTDIAPLSVFIGLEEVGFNACFNLEDISPLKNTKSMHSVEIFQTKVSDLSPLRGNQLTYLVCCYGEVSSLAPLTGMPMTHLNCHEQRRLTDLSPLKGMPLKELYCYSTGISDLTPLKGLSLERLSVRDTKATDLSPLRDLSLKSIECDFKPERDTAILRSMKTLEEINQKPVEDFWKQVEVGRMRPTNDSGPSAP